MDKFRRSIFTNPAANRFNFTCYDIPLQIERFHQSLPAYHPSPLVPLEELAQELGVKKVFIKNESSRLGLPSFKILGASWAIYSTISTKLGLSDPSLEQLRQAASQTSIRLFSATDGNHGRAVAYMAKLLGLSAEIFVPQHLDKNTQDLIAGEGARVIAVDGSYDDAIYEALDASKLVEDGVFMQDTSFEDYETIPSQIVQGYSTMLREIDQQLGQLGLDPTVFVSPVGVGSLCQAVVSRAKANGRSGRVLAVEPHTAACLHQCLTLGHILPLSTSATIMNGMECGTVSRLAWPILSAGVDTSVTISDFECHLAVEYLKARNIDIGPCGAAGLAGLRRVASSNPESIGLCPDSVIVILGTEGPRPYPIPKEVILP
ncbi:hypothetical protein FQN57_001766 [Myotisia sp. PD_48]|nr:hypothetical protein FQN57_001766 [Myotisia sp. PD_48]